MGRHNAIEVDLDGLANLVANRSMSFVLWELYQNARDPVGTKHISVEFAKVSTGFDRLYRIRVVDDNPEGFHDLSHAWTMFANSEKKVDANAAGMFNLAEKLVIAIAKEVSIVTTTGGVRFDESGRHTLRRTTTTGSEVEALLTLTQEQFAEMDRDFQTVMIPKHVSVSYNGIRIPIANPSPPSA